MPDDKIAHAGMREIFVPLLDEGTRVLRPARAISLGAMRFRLITPSDYDPDDERWEFPPGSVVECRAEMLSGREVFVAFAAAASIQTLQSARYREPDSERRARIDETANQFVDREENQALNIRDEVKDMARRAPRDPEQPNMPAGIGEMEIRSFESRTGIAVPSALREWLGFTNGPRIGMGCVNGIRTADEWTNIESFYKDDRHPEWLQNGWIPIAGDGCGGTFVLATRDSDGPGNPVFFISPDPRIMGPEYVAASDLWRFLRFYLGCEFGERGWPFDRDFVLAKDPDLARFTAVPKAWELED